MIWKEFAKKVSPLLKKNDSIELLGFKFEEETYQITSPWGSGDDRQYVNLWAKKVKDGMQIYPFFAKETSKNEKRLVDNLEFFKL